MTDAWPATLPQKFRYPSYRRETPDNRLRSPMDVGPAKLRPRSSAQAAPISGVMNMTLAQWSELLTFGGTTLLQWSLPFTFPDPDAGSDLLLRFVKLPTREPITPDRMAVSLELEILP